MDEVQMETSGQAPGPSHSSLYDIYHRLCRYQRGLGVLIFGESFASRPDLVRKANLFYGKVTDERKKLWEEFNYVSRRVDALGRRLSIEFQGDWEFLEMAQGKQFVGLKLNEPPVATCKPTQWEVIKADPILLETRRAKRRENDRLRKLKK